MLDRDEHHVAAGWNGDHDLRWIEAGRLRLEEAKDGASVTIQAPAGPTWLSATELAGLVRHLADWFIDDPAETIQRIEATASHVKAELEAWDARARIDEEHPPYAKLVNMLADTITTCRRLREDNPFAGHPEAPR